MKAITTVVKKIQIKAILAYSFFAYLFFGYLPAHALSKTDLTQDVSGGKKFEDIAANIDGAAQTGASLLIQLVSIGGFVVVAISLYTLWKASQDDREKPMSAIVGLFIGGAMAGVGTIMWMMRNTITG
jgi:hypothetical protein